MGSIPCWINKIPLAVQPKKKKEERHYNTLRSLCVWAKKAEDMYTHEGTLADFGSGSV